jgi:CDP-L-myo-inositol myo-inositolphosphotransferase
VLHNPGMAEDPLPVAQVRSLGEARSSGPADLDLLRPAVPRIGVVLAAGRSQRLADVTGGGSKALIRLGGLTLVERAVRSLKQAGVAEVVVVTGSHAGPVGAVISRMGVSRVRCLLAEDWELGNGASLAAAEPVVGDEPLFALVMADHVFSERAFTELLRAGQPAVLVDPAPGPSVWEEGCRVRFHQGRATAFGKHLAEPAVDCGAFLVPPGIFPALREAAAGGDHSLAGALSRLAARRSLLPVPLPPNSWWQDIDTPRDLEVARNQLRRGLTKESEGPISRYLNRPVSTRISMALAPLRLSPAALSFAALMLCVVAALFLAQGTGIVGGLLVQAASILDGVDGEVARLQLRAGPRGAMLDGVLDRFADVAVALGLGLWALSLGVGANLTLGLTVAAAAGSLLSMASKDRAAAVGLPVGPERVLAFLMGGRDGRLLIIAVAAIFSAPLAALVAVATTSMLSVCLRVVLVLRLARLLG